MIGDLDDYINVKIHTKDICKIISWEFWLSTNLNKKQRIGFRKHQSYFDYSELEKYAKAHSLISKKTRKVISYFGTNKRFSVESYELLIANCTYIIWKLVQDKQPLEREQCILTCYKYLRPNIKGKGVHYKSTAIASAIAYEFDLKNKTLSRIPLQQDYNNADTLFESAKSITERYKNKSTD